MSDLSQLLAQGNAWLFVPSAVALGALHGLEPGHSKTMMAAFIVAIRGTVTQAVLLGLSATVSHTAIVWAIAMAGLYFGGQLDAEAAEPYLQLVSAGLILLVAAWMLWQTWRHQRHGHHAHHGQGDGHHHHHHHHHDQRLGCNHDHGHHHGHAHAHAHAHHHHAHGHHPHQHVDTATYQDPHEQAHADDIRRRFANKAVTTPQIVVFGLTGGLIPCPASITVLLLCLQLKKVALGVTLVLCFSIGLALTMVASGVLAALSLKHVAQRWDGFGEIARKAPYFSGALIGLVGLYVGYQGAHALHLV